MNIHAQASATSTKNESFSWMYVQEKGHCIISNLPPQQAYALQEGIPGEFLWYQEAGKAYLIKDTTAIAQAKRFLNEKDPKVHGAPTHDEVIQSLSRLAIKNGLATPMPYPPVAP
jgi:hypothetical protein